MVRSLLLDLVGATEHVIDVGEVVCAGEEAIGLAGGGIALLEVGLLAEVAHLEAVSTPSRVASHVNSLTSSYTSGATTRLDSRRAGMSSCFAMFSTLPLTTKENMEDARPLP